MKRGSIKKLFSTYIVGLAVFIAALIHLWAYFKQDQNNTAEILSYGDYYLVYYFPLKSALIDLLFSLCLLGKCYLFKNCLYTYVAVWLYVLISLLTLLYIVTSINFGVYIEIFGVIFYLAIALIALIPPLKCLLRK